MGRTQTEQYDALKKQTMIRLMMGGIVLFLLCMSLNYRHQKIQIEKNTEQEMDDIKNVCQKYDDYKLGIRTKDLQNLINKANVLQNYIKEENGKSEDALQEHMTEQYLSGIILLDEKMEPERCVYADEQIGKLLLLRFRADRQVRQILNYPEKVYADCLEMNDWDYEYVIVSRKDQEGVLICYADATELQNDKYEITLSSMLNIWELDTERKVVITDGENVISTNIPMFEGQSVNDAVIRDVVAEDQWPENEKLIKLEHDGVQWYGKHDVYRGYVINVFYRMNLFDSQSMRFLAIVFACYILFGQMYMVRYEKKQKERLRQKEKEFYLLRSIASIYDVNLLLYPKENTWEALIQTPLVEETITGIRSINQMLEEFCSKLLMPSARDGFMEFLDLQTLSSRMAGKSFLVYRFEAVEGKWYQALLIPRSGESSENITAVILLIRNITEQKIKEMEYQKQLRETAEKADIANAAKTDFLRRMSHDIRTPLNGIRGMTEMGLHNVTDLDGARTCFEKIRIASDFLLELVNNVLDMSKIDAGEAVSEQVQFDMREVLHKAMVMISVQAAAAEITVNCEELHGEHWELIGSPLNVQRVFQNIMSNAVKYNRKGGQVKVSCRETACDEKYAEFEFRCEDTGIGMSKEFQDHAFELFAQEGKTARTTYGGSGLGLAIVKKTVDLMDGSIHFTSEEGKGTVFVVKLMFPIQNTLQRTEQTETVSHTISGLHILAAEDNELNMEIVTCVLEEQGAKVTPAGNGKEAVELFAGAAPGTFDVILMDIMMPEMNGLEAAKAIRSQERSDAKQIPIIAVSANAFSDDQKASRECGMNAHLSKPLDCEKLIEMIGKLGKKNDLTQK